MVRWDYDGGIRTWSMMYTVALAVLTLPHTTIDLPLIMNESPEPVMFIVAPLRVLCVPAKLAGVNFPGTTW